MATPRMSDEDLKRFVLGCCDGAVFTNRHVKDAKLIPLIFVPLAFSTDRDCLDDVGLLWEWRSEAWSRRINGYPQFGSVRLMHRDDWERARVAIERELKRRDNITV